MRIILVLMIFLTSGNWGHAQSLPPVDKLVDKPLTGYVDELEKRWKTILAQYNLKEGSNFRTDDGGKRTLVAYISKGLAAVSGNPEEGEKFLRARNNAFYVAFWRAKQELVRSMGETVETNGSLSSLQSIGEESDPVLSQALRIMRKAGDLTEKALDHEISSLDPNYDPTQYGGREEKEVKFRQEMRRGIQAFARGHIAGAMPLVILEGNTPTDEGNAYKVFVGLAWSPKMKRDALAIVGQHTPPTGPPGSGVEGNLPTTEHEAVAKWGVSRTTDANGHRIIIAYGQSAVERANSAAWAVRAQENAKASARLQAMAALREFMGETLSTRAEGINSESAAEFADGTMGVDQVSRLREYYRGKAPSAMIKGAEIARHFVVRHPASGKKLAIVAVKWSGASQQAATDLKQSMQAAQEVMRKQIKKTEKDEAKERLILQGINVNKDDL